jgi:IS605 OrfB family transposase
MIWKNRVTTAVKVQIDTSNMSQKDTQRLRQILGRDTRIINRYIGILEGNKENLVKYTHKKNGEIIIKIDLRTLDEITSTTKDRTLVQHDLKKQFPRISLNELKECRDTAVGMYLSYLQSMKKKRVSLPSNKTTKLRSIGYRRFTLDFESNEMNLIDSMDSNPKMIREGKSKVKHNRLGLDLKLSMYQIGKINEGSLKAVRIIRKKKEYYAIFAIRHKVHQLSGRFVSSNSNNEPAVVGIDLGINRDAVITVLTSHGVSHHKFINLNRVKNTQQSILKMNNRIGQIQHEAAVRTNNQKNSDGIHNLLKKLRNKRTELKRETNHQLSREIVKYIESLSDQYDLWIGIGKLKNIRNKTRRGDGNKKRRKILHRWAFAQLTDMLTYKLSLIGYKYRLLTIPESWTSIKCWKCNVKGKRPRQEYFICKNPTCKWKGDADFNGATNIGKRAAKYFKLTSHLKASLFEVRELGSAEPKAKSPRKRGAGGSSSPSNGNAATRDQVVDKNHGNPSLSISFFEGEDDRSADSSNGGSRTLSPSNRKITEGVATSDSVRGT